MRIFKAFTATLLLALTFGPVERCFAAPKPRVARTISCAPYIGDKREAVVHDSRAKPPFQCFRTLTDALKAGYQTKKTAKLHDYTSWYRLNLSKKKDTCSSFPTFGGKLTLFLQIKENSDGAFASFCPTSMDLKGSRTGFGLTVAGTTNQTVDVDSTICPDGKIAATKQVELTQSLEGATMFSVTYKVVHVCQTASYRGITCSQEFSGIAFPETHIMWPAVPNNIMDLDLGCAEASKRCVGCHPNL